MKHLCLFTLLFFVSLAGIAQNNFKPGYIITNSNDSIDGWIDFQTDATNSRVCLFKPTEKAEMQSFYPGSIAKYRFINEGKYYVSHSITIDSVAHTVFLEYLVNGMMNLYYYKDAESDREYYFFEDETGKMTQVSKKPDEIADTKVKSDLRYIGVLNYLFKDYPTIRKDINSTSFNRGSFIKLTKEYHQLTCTPGEKCMDFENDYKKQFLKINFSIYGGIQLQEYKFNAKDLIIFGSTGSLFPMIGGKCNISSPRRSKSLSLSADVSFSGLKGENDYSNEQTVYKKYKFEALTVTGRINVSFMVPSGKFRPVVEAGLSYYRLFSRSSSLYNEVCTLPITADITNNYYLPETFFTGFNFGTGFDYLIGNEHFLFCRISFEQVSNNNVIRSGQLKFGFTF